MSEHVPSARRGRDLDRSQPLTRLPALVAELEPDRQTAVLDGVTVPRLDPRLVDEVLRPAIRPAVERILDELDEQSGVRGGALEAYVRAAVDHALRQFAGIVETGHLEIDTELYRALGRKHAQSGLPLQELTGLFSRGGLATWRTLLELADRGELPDRLLRPASEAVYAFVQELTAAAVEGYAAAVAAAGTADRARRVELARQVLAGDANAAQLARHAEEVGWRVPARLRVALVTTTEAGLRLTSDLPATILGAPHAAHWCLLIPADVDVPVEPGATVAVGAEVDHQRAGASLHTAERLLALVDAGVLAEGEVHAAADQAVDLLLDAAPTIVEELVTTRLWPLLELPPPRRDPLLDTLAAWLAAPGRHTAIAERLHVHARTVRYRVDRLRELLGHGIDDPAQRLDLALAVRAVRSTPLPSD